MQLYRLEGFEREQYVKHMGLAYKKASALDVGSEDLFSSILSFFDCLNNGNEVLNLFDKIPLSKNDGMGFFHFSLLTEMISKQKYVDKALGGFPTLDSCVDDAIFRLENDLDITSIQNTLSKIQFYEKLQQAQLPQTEDWHQYKEASKLYDSHEVTYTHYNVAKMGFLVYRITAFQKGNSVIIKNDLPTEPFLKTVRNASGLATPEMFAKVNGISKFGLSSNFALYSVERLMLGPFYHPLGYVPPKVKSIFDKSESENPFMFMVEEQLSEDGDTYLTSDIETAQRRSYKKNLNPKVRYKRYFIVDSEETKQIASMSLQSPQYVSRFHVVGDTNE